MEVAARGPIFEEWVDNWWMFAVRGGLALLFGVLALLNPVAALIALVMLFGAWALVDGISALVLAFAGSRRAWQLVAVGLIGIAAGALTFFRPGLTAIGLYAAVAAWSIARGAVEIVLAIQLRKVIHGEVWLILGAVFSILFGVLLIALPLAGVLALGWLIGVYALSFGFIMCALAVRLHQFRPPRRAVPPVRMTRPSPT